MKIAAINVTALTRARLTATLNMAENQGALIIAISESKHYELKPRWILSVAAASGWGILCSEPPPRDENGRHKYGGTMILWKRTLGRVSMHRSKDHSRVALETKHQVIAVGYGPARRPDIGWIEDSFGWCDGLEPTKSRVFLGDLNWRKSYDQSIIGTWKMTPASIPATNDDTSPTRCLTNLCAAELVAAVGIEGIPYRR